MNLLTHAEARQIAEASWGKGGTSSRKTNTRGAFYFSCSGHGGFVIDARVLEPEQRERLARFVQFDTVTRYTDGQDKVYGLMTPYRSKSFRVPFGHVTEQFDIILLEEDCAWALAYVMTTVRLKADLVEPQATETAVQAAKTVWDWYDVTNPQVMARKHEQHCRENRDPGLIVAAVQTDTPGVVKVWTADDSIHYVTGYDAARDRFGTPWLSNCTLVTNE